MSALRFLRLKLPYRYIALNAVCCGTFDVVYAAVHPEVLFPVPVLAVGGMFKDTVVPDFFIWLGMFVIVTAVGGVVGSILAMVVFRYRQCT